MSPKEFEEVDIRAGDEILTIRVPKGTSDEHIKEFVSKQQSVKGPNLGPLGLIPPSFREAVSAEVERPSKTGELPAGVRRFAAQSALPTIGTLGGATLGALTGPLAPVAVPILA